MHQLAQNFDEKHQQNEIKIIAELRQKERIKKLITLLATR